MAALPVGAMPITCQFSFIHLPIALHTLATYTEQLARMLDGKSDPGSVCEESMNIYVNLNFWFHYFFIYYRITFGVNDFQLIQQNIIDNSVIIYLSSNWLP